MIVKVKRQENAEAVGRFESYELPNCGQKEVTAILNEINSKISDPIAWECSCNQKLCGACAMIINGTPSLACGVKIDTDNTPELVLEPLSKFPVIKDLMVDRSIIKEHQKAIMLIRGEQAGPNKEELDNQYQVSKCLKCGLCLEICANYTGKNFYGAIMANDSYLLHVTSADRKDEILKEYQAHFEIGCSMILACRDICPMKMPTLSSMGYMNGQKFEKKEPSN